MRALRKYLDGRVCINGDDGRIAETKLLQVP